MYCYVRRFMGMTDFAPGKWIGVELFDPRGKINGSVSGKEYFKCADQHGVFLRASQIQVYTVWSQPQQFVLKQPLTM